MTNYREILRLSALGLSQSDIARSCNASKRTVNSVLKAARRENISWPLDNDQTNAVLAGQLYPSEERSETLQKKRMPNFSHIRKELLRNGVNKKLLWAEYLEECRLSGEEPLMYSRFCYYIQKDEEKRRASMHINRSYARATAITIRESMRFIALWRSIMAQPSFRPEFEHPRINQMPEAPLDMYPPGSLPRFVMNSSFRCPN